MAKKITDRQLWFIWKAIQELQSYLSCQMEAGARGCSKDYNNGTRAREIIQEERRRRRSLKSKKQPQ